MTADPAGHQPFVGPMPSELGVAIASITITGAQAWVAVTGELAADGSFTATGTGTVAGFANIGVSFQGTLTEAGRLAGDYTMGTGGGLPGGQPITYGVEGDRAP